MDNTKKLLEKIKNEKIKPTPKRYFILKNYLMWTSFALFILFTSIAFSVTLYSVYETDLFELSALQQDSLSFSLSILPFAWIVFTILFFIIATIVIKKTKKGYKYSLLILFAIGTLAGGIIGSTMYFTGGAQVLENIFTEYIPVLESVQEKKMRVWQRPELGFLSGTIKNINNDSFILTDFNNKFWTINISNETIIRNADLFKLGNIVKISGEMIDKNNFTASIIRPWDSYDHRGYHENRMNHENFLLKN